MGSNRKKRLAAAQISKKRKIRNSAVLYLYWTLHSRTMLMDMGMRRRMWTRTGTTVLMMNAAAAAMPLYRVCNKL